MKILIIAVLISLISGLVSGIYFGRKIENYRLALVYRYQKKTSDFCIQTAKKVIALEKHVKSIGVRHKKALVFVRKNGRESCVEFKNHAIERNFILTQTVSSKENKGVVASVEKCNWRELSDKPAMFSMLPGQIFPRVQ